jgi:hypothetical protein
MSLPQELRAGSRVVAVTSTTGSVVLIDKFATDTSGNDFNTNYAEYLSAGCTITSRQIPEDR